MKYQTLILEKLIEKYERRKPSTTIMRKVAFRMQDESKLIQALEHAEEKEQFLTALDILKKRGLIDYSWLRFEVGNIVERVWLILDDDKIRESYNMIGRIPRGDIVGLLKELLLRSIEKMKVSDDEIRSFLEKQLEKIKKNLSITRFFTEDNDINEDILECLVYLSQNKQEIQERVMSSLLYGDSKYFERHIKAKVLSVLRAINKEKGEELSDEELLGEKGLVKWPEVLEFTGKLVVRFKQGECIDFSSLIFGAYINSHTVAMLDKVFLSEVRKVIFIENKANYVWYISQKKPEDELILYHGGFYSPIKGKWFKLIYEACNQSLEPVEYYHWSDIDLGGFRLFNRLKTEIIPSIVPFMMDVETLEANRHKGKPMKESYRKLLKEIRDDYRFEEFKTLIERMLELNIRLEQEQLLYK